MAPPKHDSALLFPGNPEETCHFIFFLNNLNFCSWPEKGKRKWFYKNNGEWVSGYFGKALAIAKAFSSDNRFFHSKFLATIQYEDFANIFKGKGEMQLMKERHKLIQECYRIIVENFDGKVINIIKQADFDADAIVKLLTTYFPRFNDVASFQGNPVYFLKLAQIIPSDLNNALRKPGRPFIKNLQDLTIFADTLIPQILQNEGILRYDNILIDKIKHEQLIPPKSLEEMEIRAFTIYACELLRDELEKLGRIYTSNEIDWILWSLAKQQTFSLPYHRTLSIFY